MPGHRFIEIGSDRIPKCDLIVAAEFRVPR